MTEHPWLPEDEIDKLLVMAVALWGSDQDIVDNNGPASANGWKILKQVFIWREVDVNCISKDEIDKPYRKLIQLSRDTDLVKGFGNLGNGTRPPADPPFVAFGLTQTGWRVANALFAEHPHFREKRKI